MKQYLIFLAQSHVGFRKAELESLADMNGIEIDLSNHDESHPFMVVTLKSDEEAYKLIDRAILAKGIYEIWGEGADMDEMHMNVKSNMDTLKTEYLVNCSFKFENLTFQGGKKSKSEQIAMFDKFSYLGFEGKIRMKNSDEIYTIFEKYSLGEDLAPLLKPDFVWFGRQINLSARSRGVIEKFEINKRPYFGTTTFDSELSLFTCNMAQVKKFDFVYDPFVGTGSFLVAASEFEGITVGTEIEFLTLKGKGKNKRIKDNFKYYNKPLSHIDTLCMDFTNNAFRDNLKFDCIISDPPYGVREGVKVCGTSVDKMGRENIVIDGELAYLRKDYIQPKKSYSLDLLLDDLLEYSNKTLKVGSRLCFWMPVANDEDIPTLIPQHSRLKLIYELVQDFNKWSRRFLVYVKMDDEYNGEMIKTNDRIGTNNFRDRYFKGFSKASKESPETKKENSSSTSNNVEEISNILQQTTV